MPDYLPEIRLFVANFLTGDTLKAYRQFVNVYTPNEADIKAINEGHFEIVGFEYGPYVYGGEDVFQFKVGSMSFRIWGEAMEYIKSRTEAKK